MPEDTLAVTSKQGRQEAPNLRKRDPMKDRELPSLGGWALKGEVAVGTTGGLEY